MTALITAPPKSASEAGASTTSATSSSSSSRRDRRHLPLATRTLLPVIRRRADQRASIWRGATRNLRSAAARALAWLQAAVPAEAARIIASSQSAAAAAVDARRRSYREASDVQAMAERVFFYSLDSTSSARLGRFFGLSKGCCALLRLCMLCWHVAALAKR